MQRLWMLTACLAACGGSGDAGITPPPVTVPAQPWSLTGSLTTGRALHSLTVLADGGVLAVGGQAVGLPFQILGSSERYDPATGNWRRRRARHRRESWRFACSMAGAIGGRLLLQPSTRRRARSCTTPPPTRGPSLEHDGAAYLCSCTPPRRTSARDGKVRHDRPGDRDGGIYDPAIGRWSRTSLSARGGHTATIPAARSSWQGIGDVHAPTLRSAERFDPRTDTWTTTGT
jgi:hypothetical protein